MFYTIGQISKQTGIPISTLRYYDREGMFPSMERSSGGIRVFSDHEIGVLRIIECLKKSGLPIKEIKEFLAWCEEGDASLQKRRNLFYKRREEVQRQLHDLQDTLHTLAYKCWYYDQAMKEGNEDKIRQMLPDNLPKDIQQLYDNGHK